MINFQITGEQQSKQLESGWSIALWKAKERRISAALLVSDGGRLDRIFAFAVSNHVDQAELGSVTGGFESD